MSRAWSLALVAAVACARPIAAQSLEPLAGPYIDPRHHTAIWFGAHSHWAQPWRAYQETVPAHRFLDGIGMCLTFPDGANPGPICRMLARSGVKHGRIEIGWGNLDWDDKLPEAARQRIAQTILAARNNGIRPLILLNAHCGAPCPARWFERVLAAPAKAGDTKVRLTDVRDLVLGRSGLNNLSEYWACEALVTAIDGDTVTLSKPLPKDLGARGARISMATLKYRPFSPADTPDYRATVDGWLRYVAEVTRFVTETLGTTALQDKGFDLEIWNELSFGSWFLFVNGYYKPEIAKYNQDAIFGNLVRETAAYVDAHPADFAGVSLCDGFSNTIPWPASSTEPPRVTALSKHPYAGRVEFPKQRRDNLVNALWQNEPKPTWYPTYSAAFPEYYATYLQTESVIRDLAPITTEIYGTRHGRLARGAGSKVQPVWPWFTEVGWAPNENGVADVEQGMQLKAKTTARYYCFFLNKGVQRLYLYASCEGDKWLGIVADKFVDYAKKNTDYPKVDDPYVSPALATLRRIVGRMRVGLDAKLAATRDLPVLSLSDRRRHTQFEGDGTPEHPPLYNRDVFAWLPYQVNARRFVVAYYVMTRDVTKPLPPEEYVVRIGGVHAAGCSVSAYDPVLNRAVAVQHARKRDGTLELRLTATDYPYLLQIEEPPAKGRR